MRQIKFRAWTGKKMIQWDHMLTEFTSDWFNKGWQIMQFTGLQDKNGFDIYDGDILLSASGKEKYVVIWKHAGWFKESVDFNQNNSSLYPHASKEQVIGNIYENIKK